MVLLKNYTSSAIGELTPIGGVLVYDTDKNSLVFANGTTVNDLVFSSPSSSTGINTTNPDAALEINATSGNNLRLTYNDANGSATNYTDFSLSASGDLTINASGNDIVTGASDSLNVAAHDGSSAGLKLGGTLVTATAAELNVLDGVTATATELNYNDLTTGPGTAEASKALVLNASANITTGINSLASSELNVSGHNGSTAGLSLGGVLVTATAAQLNAAGTLSGVTATTAELNYNDLTTGPGTAEASKTLVLDSSRNITNINSVNSSELTISGHNGSSAGLTLGATLVTATAVELNLLDGVTASTAELNILDGVTATAAELNILDGVTSTAAELNILDGVTATFTELNYNDLTTGPGTAEASKALILNSSSNISGINSVSSSLLVSTSSTASTSNSTGAVLLAGGLAISNTTDATSSANGGTFTTAGGAAIAKSLYVGQDLSVAGNLMVTGTTTTIESVTTVIEDNTLLLNSGPSGSGRDAGFLSQRYQVANEAGTGDVVTDTAKASFALDAAASSSITLPAGASAVNDFYNNWWIKVTSGAGNNNVRQITDYDGTTKVATLASAFTTTPSAADTVNLYNKPYTTFLWQEATNSFVSAFVAADITGALNIIDYADFRCNGLVAASANTTVLDVSGHNGSSAGLSLGGVLVTATAAQLNAAGTFSGVTATTAELNYNDLTTGPGTAEASKTLVLDASRNITNINSLTATTLVGTLSTASQPNITSVGTLTGLTSAGIATLTDTTATTSSTVGALKLAGGLAISNTTDATSSTNGGTFTTAGGMAVAKKVFMGDTLGVTGATTLSSTLGVTGATTLSSTLSASGVATFSNILEATSSTAGGCLTVSGGAAVAKKLYVGTDITGGSMILSSSEVRTAYPDAFDTITTGAGTTLYNAYDSYYNLAFNSVRTYYNSTGALAGTVSSSVLTSYMSANGYGSSYTGTSSPLCPLHDGNVLFCTRLTHTASGDYAPTLMVGTSSAITQVIWAGPLQSSGVTSLIGIAAKDLNNIVVLINDSTMFYTTNGSTFTQTVSPPANISYTAATGSNIVWASGFNKFLVGRGGGSGVAYSTDGMTWVNSTTPSTAPRSWVYYNPILNKAFAYQNGDNTSLIVSNDGITWTNATLPSLTGTQFGAFLNNTHTGLIAIYPNSGSSVFNLIYSTDGITWAIKLITQTTKIPHNGGDARSHTNISVFSNNIATWCLYDNAWLFGRTTALMSDLPIFKSNYLSGYIANQSKTGHQWYTGSTTVSVGTKIMELDTQFDVLVPQSLTDATNATSSITGSLITAGGVGIAKDVHIGQALTVNGISTLIGNVGINTTVADRQMEINSTNGNCLRLTYNDSNGSATNYTDMSITSSGNLNIAPSGTNTIITGDLVVGGTDLTQSGAITASAADGNVMTLLYNDTSSLYCNLQMTSNGDLAFDLASGKEIKLTTNSSLNINTHDGATYGLKLGNTLVTATAAEINTLDGITASTAELNYVDLTTGPGTAEASKALVLNASSNITTGINNFVSSELNVSGHNGSTAGLSLGGVLVTATAAQLNAAGTLSGVTATTAELNYNDLTTGPGTAEASKTLVLDSSSNITGINSLTSSVLTISGHNGSSAGLTLGGTLVTSTAAELNILDGVTATAVELNYVDLTTGPGTAQASKALILNASSNITTGINSLTSSELVISGHNGSSAGLTLGATLLTATAAELNLLDGVTASTVELNLLDGVTATTAELNYVDLTTGPGTAEASKALILNASNNITTGINSLTSSELVISGHNGSSAGLTLGATLVTATAAELNTLDGITSSTAELNILDGVTATFTELNYNDLTTGPGTAEASKALVLNASSNITTGINSLTSSELVISGHNGSSAGLTLGATLVTATAAELNTLDGVTATFTELNYNDLTTGPGTAEASKALVLNASSNITGINSLTSSLLVSTSSTASTSNSTGAVLLSGGLAISNTTDATSSTNGGTFTTAGGAAVAKSLYVGQNLSVAGNLMVSGTTTTIESVTTVIEDNTLLLNSGPSGSGRDSGFLAQRYQVSNDAGTGDVVTDTAKASFALDAATSSSITLPAGANATNDYYNNWWIKVTSGAGNNNVRQITDYDGTTKVATLSSAFSSTPSAADTVNLYNKPYTTFLWQEASNSFVSAFVAADITGALNIIDYADFRANNLVAASGNVSVIDISGHNGSSAGLSLGGILVTATAAELNAAGGLSGVTATTAELNYNDLTTGPGTAEPSKTLVLDSSSNITGINSLTATSLTVAGALTGATTFNASGVVTLTNTTSSTSSTIGALKLAGGLSIASTADVASGTNGGSFTTAGGMAVAKGLIVNGNITANAQVTITSTLDAQNDCRLSEGYRVPLSAGIIYDGYYKTSGISATKSYYNQPTNSRFSTALGTTWTNVDSANAFRRYCYIVPAYTETYTFYVTSIQTFYQLFINNKLVASNVTNNGTLVNSFTINLTATAYTHFLLNSNANNAVNSLVVEWQSTSRSRQIIPNSSVKKREAATSDFGVPISVSGGMTLWNSESDNTHMYQDIDSTGLITQTAYGSAPKFNFSGGNVGINTSSADKQMEINSATGDCLRLTYNDNNGTATNYVDFLVSASGDLTIDASGNDIALGATDNFNIPSHDGSSAGLTLGATLVTSTAAELNILDGVTATFTELNYNDLTTGPGTAEASKVLVLNASSNITAGINSLTSSELTISGHNGTSAGLTLGATLVTATATELNILDGITASTAELNLLDGVTASTAELNLLDGVTASTAELNILDGVTATFAELNILDGVTATFTELNYNDLTTGPGTAEASKVLVLNASSNITAGINSLTSSELTISGHNGTSAGLTLGATLVTATAAELNILDGVTASAAELNLLDGVTASTAELNILDGVTATAAELNYNDLTTGPGTAEASKTLVLDASRNITNINSLTTANFNTLIDSAANNTTLFPIAITRTTSTTPAINLGVGLKFDVENSANVNTTFGSVEVSADNITDTTESGKFTFKLIHNGADNTNVATLTSDGTFSCDNLVETSDRRVKENIIDADLEESYHKMMDIRVVDYNFIADGEKRVHRGVIAQELKEVIPNAVNNIGTKNGIENFNAVSNRELVGFLIGTVQHLNKIVEDQQKQIDELKNKM